MSYKIVADSASNIFTMSGGHYACVPLKILCGEREFPDTPELDLPEMLEFLKNTKERSTTSCPNIGDWMAAFEGADSIFAVTITGALSGSYAAAVQARELYLQEHPEAKIYVLDSLSAGPEMELILEKIQHLQQKGATFEETVSAIEEYRQQTHLIFCLQSLHNLARNGRISTTKAKLAGVLGIRIIGKASDEGTLQPTNKARGAGKSLEAILALMQKCGFSGGKVRIAHCNNAPSAELLKQIILTYAPSCDIHIKKCTALCSFYAEEGGLMIGFEE